MRPGIECLMMSKGKQLTDDVREVLLQTAREMVRSGKAGAPVRSDVCQGIVETEGKHLSLGTMSGQAFKADVVTAHGEMIEVSFLVQTRHLEENMPALQWIPGRMSASDIPEELRPSKRSRLN